MLTPLRARLRKRIPSPVISNLAHRIREKKNILGKRPRQRLLTADLLPADKRIHRHGDGAVDVLRSAVLGQAHLAESFADAHDGFQMTDLRSRFISIRGSEEGGENSR